MFSNAMKIKKNLSKCNSVTGELPSWQKKLQQINCTFPWQYKNKNKKQPTCVKVFSLPEGNTFIAEPNLEVLPLTKIK